VSRFNSRMQCNVVEIDIAHIAHVAYVTIDPGHAADMNGCIETVRQHDAGVVEINVFEGENPDMRYTLNGGKWTASRLVWKEPATAIPA
jgi:hypothetical protein